MSRLLLLAAALALFEGCQCYQPVFEGSDAGKDGGKDGGFPDAGPDAGGVLDAGSTDGGSGCTVAADCVGPAPAQSLCNFGGDAGASCIDRRCVFECSKGRACTYDAGSSCLACTSPVTSGCVTGFCGAMVLQGQVEQTTAACQLGFTDVMLVPTGGCQYDVTTTAGVTVGKITQTSTGDIVGQFDGGTCIGFSLATQVERWLFSCEGCQFVLRI